MNDTTTTDPVRTRSIELFTLDAATHTVAEVLGTADTATASEAAQVIRAAATAAGTARALAPLKHVCPGFTAHLATLGVDLLEAIGYEPLGSSACLELVIELAPQLAVLDAVLAVGDEREETRVRLPEDHPLVIAAVALLHAEPDL